MTGPGPREAARYEQRRALVRHAHALWAVRTSDEAWAAWAQDTLQLLDRRDLQVLAAHLLADLVDTTQLLGDARDELHHVALREPPC